MSSLIRNRAASTPEMLAAMGDLTMVRAALDFEAALARALAAEGVIATSDAEAIATACASLPVDIPALADAAAHAGTLAIPLIAQIRGRVGADAANKVHMGATSQDLADTALILQAKAAGALIEAALDRVLKGLVALTETHATTPMLGRTLLQGALPITFGLKTAHWLLAVEAARARFKAEQKGALMLQFGGAVGSYPGLGGKGFAVAKRLADALDLACPPLSWHARRDGIAGLACALAIITGAVAKIARDISLLAQNEVAEAFEPPIAGRGTSSAMSHKRNPTSCQLTLSAALRAPSLAATILSALPQEHERGLGGWQAEAPVLAELYQLAHGALSAMAVVIEGLEVDTGKMRANLDAAGVGGDVGESAALARRALERTRDVHDQ